MNERQFQEITRLLRGLTPPPRDDRTEKQKDDFDRQWRARFWSDRERDDR